MHSLFDAILMEQGASAATDPSFANVNLLAHYDVDFTDVAGHSTTGTINATVSALQSKFGGKSLKIASSSPNEAVKYSCASGDFAFGTGDYTVEMWLYLTAYSANGGFFSVDATSGFQLGMKGTGEWGIASSGTAWRQTTTTLPSLNSWHHIAACRSSGTQKLFIDGVAVSSAASSTNFVGGTIAIAGGVGGGNESISGGYIDDIRVTKGVARYTSDFTPPSAPFPDA